MSDELFHREDKILEIAELLFARAVAQGMHAPFPLDCDYWGREYAAKLLDALVDETALGQIADTSTPRSRPGTG